VWKSPWQVGDEAPNTSDEFPCSVRPPPHARLVGGTWYCRPPSDPRRAQRIGKLRIHIQSTTRSRVDIQQLSLSQPSRGTIYRSFVLLDLVRARASSPGTSIPVWHPLIDGRSEGCARGTRRSSRASSRDQSGPDLVSMYPYQSREHLGPTADGRRGLRYGPENAVLLGGEQERKRVNKCSNGPNKW